jgi:hypothetical protein
VTAPGELTPLPVNGLRAPSSRTAAATEARKRAKAERLAVELAPRVALLDDQWVIALADRIVEELVQRGLGVDFFEKPL